MPCDICSASPSESVITPVAMSGAVKKGFNPFSLGLVPPALARLATPDYPAKWEHQTIDGILSHSDWTLCEACTEGLNRFLNIRGRDHRA
ncbi:MAG: hypothetical protein WCL49_01965 [bacterium]